MPVETFFNHNLNTIFVILINTILYGFIAYVVIRILKALWKRNK